MKQSLIPQTTTAFSPHQTASALDQTQEPEQMIATQPPPSPTLQVHSTSCSTQSQQQDQLTSKELHQFTPQCRLLTINQDITGAGQQDTRSQRLPRRCRLLTINQSITGAGQQDTSLPRRCRLQEVSSPDCRTST